MMTSAGSIASGGRSRGRSSGFTPDIPSSANPPRTLLNASVCTGDPCDDQGNKTGCSATGAAGAAAGFEAAVTNGSFSFDAANEKTFEGVPNFDASAVGLTTPAVANFTKGEELLTKGKGRLVAAGLLVGAIGVGDGLDSLEGEGDLAPKARANVGAGAGAGGQVFEQGHWHWHWQARKMRVI